MTRAPAPIRKRALCVFVILLGAYLATSSFRVDTIDTGIRLRVARSLVEEGTPAIERLEFRTPFGAVGSFAGSDGRYYSVYGLGQSLLFVPAVLLGGERAAALATLLNPLVTAAACALLVVWGGALGYSIRSATALGLIVGLGTLAWPHAKFTFEAPLQMLALATALFLLTDPDPAGRRRASVGRVAVAGGVVGFALLVRPSAILMVPGLLFLLNRRRLPAFLAGCAPWVLLALYYNFLRWGSPLASGYAETGFRYFEISWQGIVGLLVSPGRGFFWYSPILLLTPLGFRPLRERHPRLVRSILVVAGTYLAFFSFTTIWNGDWSWGPRHVLPLVPLIALFLLPVLDRVSRPAFVMPLVGLSVLVQLIGVSVNYESFYLWHNDQLRRAGRLERASRMHFSPATSQLYVELRQALVFFARWPSYAPSYRPEVDGDPYAEILQGSARLTKRVPDYWWVYFPLTGVPAGVSIALGATCLGLVGGGVMCLRRGQPAS